MSGRGGGKCRVLSRDDASDCRPSVGSCRREIVDDPVRQSVGRLINVETDRWSRRRSDNVKKTATDTRDTANYARSSAPAHIQLLR